MNNTTNSQDNDKPTGLTQAQKDLLERQRELMEDAKDDAEHLEMIQRHHAAGNPPRNQRDEAE